jgi:hypothetical protein
LAILCSGFLLVQSGSTDSANFRDWGCAYEATFDIETVRVIFSAAL